MPPLSKSIDSIIYSDESYGGPFEAGGDYTLTFDLNGLTGKCEPRYVSMDLSYQDEVSGLTFFCVINRAQYFANPRGKFVEF